MEGGVLLNLNFLVNEFSFMQKTGVERECCLFSLATYHGGCSFAYRYLKLEFGHVYNIYIGIKTSCHPK